MRLLYVAASRAEDRLILSGVTEELATLEREERFVAEMDLAVAGIAANDRRAMSLNSRPMFSCN